MLVQLWSKLSKHQDASLGGPRRQLSNQFAQSVHQTTGVKLVKDYNTGLETAVSPVVQYYINSEGERSSMGYATSLTFDENGVGRNETSNLIVYSESRVTKILFDKTDCDCHQKGTLPRAIGATFVPNGNTYKVFASQIDLACGPFTPFLLQYSGIGDRELLIENRIPRVFANPNVGQHLVMNRKPLMIIKTTNPAIVNELNSTLSGGVAVLPLPHETELGCLCRPLSFHN